MEWELFSKNIKIVAFIYEKQKKKKKLFFITNCDKTVMTTLSCDGIDHPNPHCSIE